MGSFQFREFVWKEEQNDPDNWLEIPDFGVKPADVAFQGFAFPIIGPKSTHYQARTQMKEMLATARRMAQQKFSSLVDLNAAFQRATDNPWLSHESAGPAEGDAKIELSPEENAAFRYMMTTHHLKHAVQNLHHSESSALHFTALAANFLIGWALNRPVDYQMDVADAVRKARSESGRIGAFAKLASDPKQKDKAMVRECWDAWQKNPANYKSKASFARDMLSKYESLESQRVIERWCTEWESVLS